MSAPLPRVSPGARFVPHDRLAGVPHAVVDGARLPDTVLALSHWPGTGCPPHLRADTGTAIVDRYLAADPDGPPLRAVTNNHFDEDGLLGVWMLLARPPFGSPERRLAVAAAEAGDFGTWTDPDAVRVALAVMALAEPATTPLPAVARALAPHAGRDPSGALYEAILPRVASLLARPGRAERLWGPAWRRLERDMALLDTGRATIVDRPDADVAIVRAPHPLADPAVHPRTPRLRVLTATPDGVLVLSHRYETWVAHHSRARGPRADLAPLLERLQAAERRPGTWRFEGAWAIRARLFLAGDDGAPSPSSLEPERLADELARGPGDARAAAA